jgi:hypothetical protein
MTQVMPLLFIISLGSICSPGKHSSLFVININDKEGKCKNKTPTKHD